MISAVKLATCCTNLASALIMGSGDGRHLSSDDGGPSISAALPLFIALLAVSTSLAVHLGQQGHCSHLFGLFLEPPEEADEEEGKVSSPSNISVGVDGALSRGGSPSWSLLVRGGA